MGTIVQDQRMEKLQAMHRHPLWDRGQGPDGPPSHFKCDRDAAKTPGFGRSVGTPHKLWVAKTETVGGHWVGEPQRWENDVGASVTSPFWGGIGDYLWI